MEFPVSNIATYAQLSDVIRILRQPGRASQQAIMQGFKAAVINYNAGNISCTAKIGNSRAVDVPGWFLLLFMQSEVCVVLNAE